MIGAMLLVLERGMLVKTHEDKEEKQEAVGAGHQEVAESILRVSGSWVMRGAGADDE